MADVIGEADSGGGVSGLPDSNMISSGGIDPTIIQQPAVATVVMTTRNRHLTRAAVAAAAAAANNMDTEEHNKVVTTMSVDNASNGMVYKCEQCDSYESTSHSALLAHIAQSHSREVESEAAIIPQTIQQPPPLIKVTVDNTTTTTAAAAAVTNTTTAGGGGGGADRPPHRKLFECDVCNMKFSNGANMRRHRMRHTGVKPYECRVCQKRFFRKDHLAEHFTTHTKTLPYHCPICNRGFQRQIAMRAHFQNEHVGQHDLVKSCPLCSYRAGSMKSLRVHFFNRHGIDLDNPGPAGSQASLLAAAAAAGHLGQPMDQATMNALSNLSVSVTTNYSDSGDSNGARSADNATPPMHFLTPHVEISMADAPTSFSPPQGGGIGNDTSQQRMNGECPNSPQSADSNSNAPSSSHHITSIHSTNQSQTTGMIAETTITPSISLIPIKQEPHTDDNSILNHFDPSKLRGITINGPVNLTTATGSSGSATVGGGSTTVQLQSATSSSLSNLIKVSPLKSLLREDLKRKMANRNSATRSRSTMSPVNSNRNDNECNDQTTNGIITSTGPEHPSDSSTIWRTLSKRSVLNGSLHCPYCGISFPDQTLYFLHKGCHSDANPWKCNICGEQCSNVYEFNSHLLSKSHQ